MDLEGLDKLLGISERLVEAAKHDFVRYLYADINFGARMLMVKGGRGVGKTTLLLQYLHSLKDQSQCAYLSLDHLFFTDHRISAVIETLYVRGYRVFLLDEVHKYPLWSIELKNLYDSYADIQLLVTASSALNLSHGSADLSRRIDVYTLHAMSFREFLRFEYGHELPVFTFETLLANHEAIYRNYYEPLDLGRKFQRYLKYGAYPFYKEAGHHYHERLLQVVAQVIDVDMPAIFRIDYESSRQVKRLLTLTARLGPFVPNVSKLGRDLAMSRNSILAYLDYLESAALLNILKSGKKSDSALTKPDKILPENTNLVYALGHVDHNKGTLRETYAVNALKVRNTISTPAKGDLLLDRHYTLEIGGPGKTFHQLADMPNPIIIRDGTEKGAPGILPLWMLGLLY